MGSDLTMDIVAQTVIPYDFVSESMKKFADGANRSNLIGDDAVCCCFSQKCVEIMPSSLSDPFIPLHVMLHTAKIKLRDYNGDMMNCLIKSIPFCKLRVELSPKQLPLLDSQAACFIPGIIRINSLSIDEFAADDTAPNVLDLATTISTDGIDSLLTGMSHFADAITHSQKSFPSLVEYFEGKSEKKEKDVCFAPKDSQDLFHLAAALSTDGLLSDLKL